MKKYSGTRYNSLWDASTWMILIPIVAACVFITVLGAGIGGIIITTAMTIVLVVGFAGTYYSIDGNNLIVYSFFKPSVFPIDKISEINPTTTILSAPATSLKHRIAIKFSDRKVLRSSMPLIISPVRQKEFIEQLTAINPEIKY